MRSTGRHLLNLILAFAGLLIAALAARSVAHHGGNLIWQTALGTCAYAAATGIAGRLLAIHPADAIVDSITALVGTVAAVLALIGLVLTAAGDIVTGSSDDTPASAPADMPDALTKTA